MSSDSVVIDTHALLWWQAGSDRLSPLALDLIESSARVLVSPITFWEVAMLVEKGRVGLDRPVSAWTNDITSATVGVADLTPQVAVTAGTLADFHGDPADRLIYATAQVLAIPLVTKDRRLADYAERTGSVTVRW